MKIRTNENIGPQILSFDGVSNIIIRIIGVGAMRTVSLSSSGSVFTVERGITLILDNNITLQGLSGYSSRESNESSLVYVKTGGVLTMTANSRITGNRNYDGGGGGVYVEGGDFSMQGSATVIENTASYSGGGVHIKGGSFTMQDNTAVSGNSSWYRSGGGVYIEGGTFLMEGNATVTGNAANNTLYNASGGGVYIQSGIFTMEGNATVTRNTTGNSGGGVYVASGSLSIEGSASVSGNTAAFGEYGSGNGGGVYLGNGTFTLRDKSIISRNIVAKGDGGGVYLSNGTFTIQDDSVISGNTATQGGGVRINGGAFTKTGGTIFGNDAPSAQRNTASGLGHAVHAGNSRYRNATAGSTVNTNSPSFWAND
jgi:hypothetical protein